MKKLLIIFGVVFILLIGAMALIPIIFKDDIKAAVDKTLAESINADVIWDTNDFSISLFTNFPNATVELINFGIVNKPPFEGQLLFAVESFEVEVDLFSLFGEQIAVNGIQLVRPEINIHVLEDGTANYDIVITTDEVSAAEVPVEDTEATKFNVAINHWSIIEAHVVYNDETLPFKMEIKNLEHSGSGDFNEAVFDISTLTDVESVSMIFDGVEYLSDKRFISDVVMTISDDYSRYTFKENAVALNEFSLGFDGYFLMKEEGYEMDISYSSKDNSFKSLLSLVPGAYLEGFESVKTSGSLSFGGAVKGVYTETSLPAFNLNLEVADAMFQYPDLPTAANNINIKTIIDNPDGVINNTVIAVSKFEVNLGGNPFAATLKASNLDDVKWDLNTNGTINLNTVSQIMPLEGMTLAGLIDLKLNTKGQLSLIEAEKYDQLPTDGSLMISDFKYTDETLPYDVTIKSTKASFDPKEIKLSNFDAQIGKSDMQMNGLISNYLAYALDEKQVLKGIVNFTSTKLDLNEFMEEETAADDEVVESVAEDDTTSLEVIPIPQNIDFTLTTKIQTVSLSDMSLTAVSGDVVVKEGIANLSGLSFNTLGGQFVVSGSYNTQDVKNPAYDFKLDIDEMSISESYAAFSIIQEYVPLAKTMTGDLSTKFEISGLLMDDMMPNYGTINGAGLLNIAQAALDKPKFLSDLNSLTSVARLGGDSDKVTLKDVLMSATIKDGNLMVRPFDIKIGNYTTNVSGTTSVDGKLDYKLDMVIPAGAIGSQVNSLLNKYTGSNNTSSNIQLPIGVGGTVTDPTYKLLGAKPDVKVKDVAKAVAKEVIEEELGVDLEEEKEKQRQKIMTEAQVQADKIIAEGKSAANKIRKEGYAQADNLVKEAGSNFLKKKIAEEAAKKLKSETDKKAQLVEDESKENANKLLAKAKEKANSV